MDHLQKLLDVHALQQMKARYFLFLDTKDWSRWLDLFTEDATLLVDTAASTFARDAKTLPKVVGRDALREFVVPNLDKTPTVHHGHTPIFEFHSETEASGIWAMEDVVEFTDHTVHGHGHYRETYRKISGEWRFASVHLTRIRVVTTHRG